LTQLGEVRLAMARASPDAPILGYYKDKKKSQSSSLAQVASPSAIAAALGLSPSSPSPSSPFNPAGDTHGSKVMSPMSPLYRTDGNWYLTPPHRHHHSPSTASLGPSQQLQTFAMLEPHLPLHAGHLSHPPPRSPSTIAPQIVPPSRDADLLTLQSSRDRLPVLDNPDPNMGDTSQPYGRRRD